ncbi:MAG: response regulator [Acidobacteria bacterium]|nr:response regulator [Acidobacteriota bacterium]
MKPGGANQNGWDQFARAPRWKVLVIHEDPGELHYYCDVLEGFGCRVWACDSYQDGIHCLDDGAFDFVMVSQGTPSFEGRCVLERAVVIDRLLPVLVVARCLDMMCYLESMQLGAVDYLVEPITASEIGRVFGTHVRVQSIAA